MLKIIIFCFLTVVATAAIPCTDFTIHNMGDFEMRIKAGVKMQGVRNEIMMAANIANDVWKKYGEELVITSGREGKHRHQGGHAKGDALDLRTRYFSKEQIPKVVEDLKKALWDDSDIVNYGKKLKPGDSQESEYLVVFEGNHIHMEYIPAT